MNTHMQSLMNGCIQENAYDLQLIIQIEEMIHLIFAAKGE